MERTDLVRATEIDTALTAYTQVAGQLAGVGLDLVYIQLRLNGSGGDVYLVVTPGEPAGIGVTGLVLDAAVFTDVRSTITSAIGDAVVAIQAELDAILA